MTAALALLLAAPEGRAAELPYAESFAGTDGVPWPAPWVPGTPHVTVWDQQGGRARLNGDATFVSRMLLPGYAESGVEALVTFEFENVTFQGIGFYVRQNGGTLQEYLPHGEGYAMFLKGPWAWPDDLGLWREIDGIETQFAQGLNPIAGGLENFTRYRLRFRVTQQDPATTLLQARVWPEASAEPAAWSIEATDTQPELQGAEGSFAIDIYNHAGASPVYVDDVLLVRFPYAASAPAPSAPSGLQLSGPRPNPARGAWTCDLTLAVESDVDVALFDLAGRQVARPLDGRLPSGTHTLRVDLTHTSIGAGVYVLVARAGGDRAEHRVVCLP